MKGFPKNLNTKEDYLYVKDNFSRDVYAPVFQDLLDTENDWFFVRELDVNEVVELTDNVKVIDNKSYDGKSETKSLYEYRQNPECKMLQLGFTKDIISRFLCKESDGLGLAKIGL